jgi:hypothetical protein
MDINGLRHQEQKKHMIIFHRTMDIAVAKEDGWVAQLACIMPKEDEKVDYEIVA